ncbi:hypothetical protein PHYPSEUDO_009066 [Phytophthora pseudosyringae]|uniref:Uncharacterized protein n=1 Tax=Phytophthora pseudosyringae TaxID=221518 RepID=A0A8T1VCW8_9STRA|nr:hypothetical protein PHYPSEUDO_009066 [Phytophthora pseudosyringae]
MSSQSLAGRKRRVSDETAPQIRGRRRRVRQCQVKSQAETFREKGDGECEHQGGKGKPGAILLSSPTDVSAAVVQVRQVRTKQAKASGLPNFSLSPPEAIVTNFGPVAKDEEASELEEDVEAGALTPRPTVRRRSAPRPPLSRRRAVGLNCARFGVGIVRCRSWSLNGEDTETEDESPACSPRRANLPSPSSAGAFQSVVRDEGYGCSEGGNSAGNAKLETQVGTSVLPIDPSQNCFDRSYSEDQWQIRSPSPDEEFDPENSCCAATSVEKTTKNDEEQYGSEMCKPKPVHAAHVESN